MREEVITVGRLRRWVDEGREVVGMNGLRWVGWEGGREIIDRI